MNSLLNISVCRLVTQCCLAAFPATVALALVVVGCGGAAPKPSTAAAGAEPRGAQAAAAEVPPSGALQFSEPQLKRAAGAPLALTASDGTGLTLTSLVAHAVVREPLAFTELVLRFDNPRDRSIEGTFSITLPPRASIARFAMRNADGWQEAEVVELQAARRAYEDFLHRRQDPALLEQAAGNQFTARVFPIPAHAVKELLVSYSEELTAGLPYALPLKGLPEVAELDVSITDPSGTNSFNG